VIETSDTATAQVHDDADDEQGAREKPNFSKGLHCLFHSHQNHPQLSNFVNRLPDSSRPSVELRNFPGGSVFCTESDAAMAKRSAAGKSS
jgi:hypothetical protein